MKTLTSGRDYCMQIVGALIVFLTAAIYAHEWQMALVIAGCTVAFRLIAEYAFGD